MSFYEFNLPNRRISITLSIKQKRLWKIQRRIYTRYHSRCQNNLTTLAFNAGDVPLYLCSNGLSWARFIHFHLVTFHSMLPRLKRSINYSSQSTISFLTCVYHTVIPIFCQYFFFHFLKKAKYFIIFY